MGTISIALCFDNSYFTSDAGTLASIVKHDSDGNQCDICIVHDSITEHNRELLRKINNSPSTAGKSVAFDITGAASGAGHLYVLIRETPAYMVRNDYNPYQPLSGKAGFSADWKFLHEAVKYWLYA